VSSRLTSVFDALRAQGRCGLVTYVTAGDPDYARSREVLLALDRAGADVLEVGVPFSEPLADGPVIQRASERALANGMSLARTLDLVEDVGPRMKAPVVLFTYANPVYRFGVERFVSRAAAAGVDGVLVLDLPIEEADGLRAALSANGLDTILLLSPTTSEARIRKAAELGSGFLYGISRLGVTGARSEVAAGAKQLAERIRRHTTLPIALGFGLCHPDHIAEVGRFADAAVVGSALVSVIAAGQRAPAEELGAAVDAYVRWLRGTRSEPMVAHG
jgi:tryptophan synthase alpha chain